MTAIEVSGLVKQFKQHRALDQLSFSVPEGSVFGFLGPNGAGKTTTIRILLGLAHADGGSASVLGADVLTDPQQVAPQVGFLPDVPSFYPWMRADEYLRFCASLFGLSGTATTSRSVHRLRLVMPGSAMSTAWQEVSAAGIRSRNVASS